MPGFLEDRLRLFRFFAAFHFVGRAFLKLSSLSSVVKRYVCAEEAVVVGGKRKSSESGSVFEGEAASFFYMNPAIDGVFGHHFHEFQRYTMQCGQPIGSILISKRDVCRACKKNLSVDAATHVVVIYHRERGSYLGTRITKFCRVCKIYEHHGYWTLNGKRQFDLECLDDEFFLSSEDTAFQTSLLKDCANFLIVGAVPFATFAMVYNRRSGFKCGLQEGEGSSGSAPVVKRMKRYCREFMINRVCCSSWSPGGKGLFDINSTPWHRHPYIENKNTSLVKHP